MPSRQSRPKWRRTENGLWTLSLGERGVTVRLFEKRGKNGMIYREVQLPGGKKSRASLGTRDKDEAEALGREILLGLMSGKPITEPNEPARLGELCDRFLVESPLFLDNTEKNKKDARTQLEIITSAVGRTRDVRTLSENDVRQYEARRRNGGIQYADGKVTKAVRQRTVQSDVKLLKQVFYWAASVTLPNGERLLERNPIEYVSVKGEHDVRRPVATLERFEAIRRAMHAKQERYEIESQTLDSAKKRAQALRRRDSWIRAELALVLLEATGRRRGAINGLRWEDIDFERGQITWQPAYDKRKKTWVIPYPPPLIESLRLFKEKLGASSGFVFARQDGKDGPAPPQLITDRILEAEEAAGLPKLQGGVTHPFRRKWRSERQHLPLKAVAVAGGWNDLTTMERSYDFPEDSDILAVTSEPRKRREVQSSASSARN